MLLSNKQRKYIHVPKQMVVFSSLVWLIIDFLDSVCLVKQFHFTILVKSYYALTYEALVPQCTLVSKERDECKG